MVGPFMQGMLLMGVIYWYSKGMLNMINEYYRTEFQKQLETKSPNQKTSVQDDIEALLASENQEIEELKSPLCCDILESRFCLINKELGFCYNQTELQRFLELTLSVCFSSNWDIMLSDKT